MVHIPFDLRSTADILSTFGMRAGDAGRGFDTETQSRVYADGLIRSRGRFAHYRTLYAAFIDGGSPFMIETLDEADASHDRAAKLVFVDHEPGPEVADNPLMVVWTERLLLDALTHERSVQDFFADLLDELAAAAGESDAEERRS